MNLFEKQSRLNQLFTQSPVNAAYLAGSLSNRTSFGHLTDVDIGNFLVRLPRHPEHDALLRLIGTLIEGSVDPR